MLTMLSTACAPSEEIDFDTGSGAALSGWVSHKDDIADYSFLYPTRLEFSSDGQVITLMHEVAHAHADPCDFKGDGAELPSIVDFRVTMEMLEKNLRDAVLEKEGSDYVATEYMRDGEFVTGGDSPVEAVTFRQLKGHRITSGVEGCGRHTYYFVSPSGRTFVVQRRIVPEFGANHPYAEELRGLAGVIPPEQEEMLFRRLMSTVSFGA